MTRDFNNDKGVNCLVCGELCSYLHMPNSLYPNINGTMFESTGNFGSTIWDMEGRKFLQMVICDPCLVARAESVNVVEWEYETPPKKLKKLINRRNLKQFREKEGGGVVTKSRCMTRDYWPLLERCRRLEDHDGECRFFGVPSTTKDFSPPFNESS